MKTAKKLYRSSTDKIIAGVCGGLGEYFNIDATLVRIVFVVLALADGAGLILYLALALIIPSAGGAPLRDNAAELTGQAKKLAADFKKSNNGQNFLGVVIVVVGLAILLKNIMPFRLMWFGHGMFWSLIIIVIGLYLIFKNKK